MVLFNRTYTVTKKTGLLGNSVITRSDLINIFAWIFKVLFSQGIATADLSKNCHVRFCTNFILWKNFENWLRFDRVVTRFPSAVFEARCTLLCHFAFCFAVFTVMRENAKISWLKSTSVHRQAWLNIHSVTNCSLHISLQSDKSA